MCLPNRRERIMKDSDIVITCHQNQLSTVKPVVGLIFSAVVMFPAFAQEESKTLEVIEVTTQKRTQSIQKVPIAISAFSAEDLQRTNSSNMADLQYFTPNLTVSSSSKVAPRMGIRGISDFSRNSGYDNRVSVYIDGIYAGRSGASNQSTLDIQRVEVLRGPQGTLFGKNTVAGAISLVTNKPTEDYRASVELEAGNDGYTSVTGMVNGTLIKDSVLAKLIVNDKQRDGYKTNIITGEDFDGLDQQAARLQLSWLLNDGEVNISADYSDDKAPSLSTEAVNDSFAPKKFEFAINGPSEQSVKTSGYGVTIDHALPEGFELTAISGYRKTDLSSSLDEDYSPLDVAISQASEDSHHFSQELRLISPMNDTFDYVVGLFYFDQGNKSNSAAIGGDYFPNPNTSVKVSAQVDVTSVAAFIHGNYRLSKRWELTGGLRYTDEKKNVDYTIVDTTGLFTNGKLEDQRNAEDFSPKLGVNFNVNQDLMFYSNYAKGFKSGGWNVDTISTFEQIAFDDEKVESYELGVKSTLFNDRVRFNAALYNAHYDDFQVFQFVPVATGGTILSITNAGEVTAKGFEADINWAVTNNFVLWATYGYTDSYFNEFKDGGGIGVNYDGNQTADAPKQTYSLGVEYRYPIANLGELVSSFNYSYRDGFYTNPNNLNANYIDDYDLMNARVGIVSDDDKWSLYASVKNLSNADDITEQSVSFLNIQRANYLEPRMFGLSFKYHFEN